VLTNIDHHSAAALERWSVTEGMETSTTVNIYSTLLLAVLLLPKLIESGRRFQIQPRLTFVVSGLGFMRRKQMTEIQDDVFGGLAIEAKADMKMR
jgi:hypothetical protein